MKKSRWVLFAAIMFVSGFAYAQVARADTFACVNKSSGTPKIVASCDVGTNNAPCHNNDVCVDLSSSSAGASLSLTVVCETQTASESDGGFNIDALCPAGQVVVSGGYQCTDANGNLLNTNVQANGFHFSNVTPDGWEVIGTTQIAAGNKCRVCATCNLGGVAP